MQEYIYINIECITTTKQHYNCNSKEQEHQNSIMQSRHRTRCSRDKDRGDRKNRMRVLRSPTAPSFFFFFFFKWTNELLVSPRVPFLCRPKSYFYWIPTIHFHVANNLCHKLKRQLTIASQYTPNASGSDCHLIEKSNNFLSLVNPNNWAVLFNEM